MKKKEWQTPTLNSSLIADETKANSSNGNPTGDGGGSPNNYTS